MVNSKTNRDLSCFNSHGSINSFFCVSFASWRALIVRHTIPGDLALRASYIDRR